MAISKQSQLWIEAAKILASDPRAEVGCPKCGAYLNVRDVPWTKDPTYIERYLECPRCGAYNVMRMHVSGMDDEIVQSSEEPGSLAIEETNTAFDFAEKAHRHLKNLLRDKR